MKSRLRRVCLFALLGFGALAGATMDPQEIEELLDTMNQTRIELVIEQENNEDATKKSGP